MIVALFGVPGNMGTKVVEQLVNEDYITRINILVRDKKGLKKVIRKIKKSKKEYRIVFGTIANIENVKSVISGVDYLVNMAAVIPPETDKNPQSAIEANELGPEVMLKAIEDLGEKQPKLIHISTIGLYGDRNYKHPFAEVGDPLLISPFDIYSLTKMRGEYKVLESNIKEWVVLRQVAMLYDEILMKNNSDGLMFHTCFNAPLEWSTAEDSAILIRNILRRDRNGELNEDNFWKHCFNLGGGEESRVVGYDTFRLGFATMGGKVEDFFDTNYNSIRNFHGEWYSDAYKLNDLFDYQHQTIEGFWKHIADTHKYFKMAALCPKKLLRHFVTGKLLKDTNAPMYWKEHNDEARMFAYFDGIDGFNKIEKDWNKFGILSKNKTPDGEDIDYLEFRRTPTRLEHFFDIDKNRKEIDINDLRKVAEARGGKLLTEDFAKGDIYRKVQWQNADGEVFEARPHSVLFCGHWFNVSYVKYAWDFDRLAKTDKMVAQIWYDSHRKDEDRYYWYDSHFNAHYKNLK